MAYNRSQQPKKGSGGKRKVKGKRKEKRVR